ncbi:MAG: hypothetical protein ACLUFL_01895 [Flavonifractor plautii]
MAAPWREEGYEAAFALLAEEGPGGDLCDSTTLGVQQAAGERGKRLPRPEGAHRCVSRRRGERLRPAARAEAPTVSGWCWRPPPTGRARGGRRRGRAIAGENDPQLLGARN